MNPLILEAFAYHLHEMESITADSLTVKANKNPKGALAIVTCAVCLQLL